MFSIRSFLGGFAVGFGSGIAFRALAEQDFEPIKEVLKSTIGAAQKMGDVAGETFGRLRETAEDVWAHARTKSVKAVPAATAGKKPRKKSGARPQALHS